MLGWGFIAGMSVMWVMHIYNVKKLLKANAALVSANRKAMQCLSETAYMLNGLAKKFEEPLPRANLS